MKKVIAIIVSIQFVFGNTLPVAAQNLKRVVQETVPAALSSTLAKDVAENYAKQMLLENAASSVTSNLVHETASNWRKLRAAATNAELSASITRAVSQEVFQNILQSQKFLADARITSLKDLPKAVGLWQQQIGKQTDALLQQPLVNLSATHLITPENKGTLESVKDLLNTISMLGLYGSAQTDGATLLNAYKSMAQTPITPLVTTTVARALLRLKAYDKLTELAELTKDQTLLWKGIRQFAIENKLDLALPTAEGNVHGLMYASALYPFGKFAVNAADPSKQATAWYMGLDTTPPAPVRKAASVSKKSSKKKAINEIEDFQPRHFTPLVLEQTLCSLLKVQAQKKKPETAPAVQEVISSAAAEVAQKAAPAVQDATLFQQASLYIASFVTGLEIGTPVMASLGAALKLPLEENILVAVATYLPYSLGAFFSDWLKGKIGRKATMNAGLSLMGGSFLAGSTVLGLDGSFEAWANPTAHFWSILGALTVASLGSVFIHNAAGPIMTELSEKTTDLIRQKRGAFVELSRAAGMLSSYAFPFLATSVMGLDWSAPFLMALPFVGTAAVGLNLAHIPNTRPAPIKKEISTEGTSVMQKLKNNRYVRLFREDKSVAPLLGGLLLMNAVETAYNGGFILMLPSLTKNLSSQYLLGLTQFALPFILGRYLASGFLKWFPKRNLSIAMAIASIAGLTAMNVTHDLIPLTISLFTAELGISTMFTLSFARTAKNPATQDRIMSLIVASAGTCAIGTYSFIFIAQRFVEAGWLDPSNTIATALITIPTILALFSTGLLNKVERITGNLGKSNGWSRFKNFLNKRSGNSQKDN